MTHGPHSAMPDYSPNQLLVDGCGECEYRVNLPDRGIGTLDRGNFAKAWVRAAEFERHGLPDVSRAERPMLRVLWVIQVQLENQGWPIGRVPSSDALWTLTPDTHTPVTPDAGSSIQCQGEVDR